MSAGIDEAGKFQVTRQPNRQRPKMPDNYWQAENERVGGSYSMQAGYSRGGNSCVRTTFVPWEIYPDAVRSILGYTTSSGNPLQLTRHLPYRDPVDHNLYAQSVSVRGFSPDGFGEWVPDGDTTQTPRWPLRTHERHLFAELTVTFGTIRHRLAEDEADAVSSVDQIQVGNQLVGDVVGRDPADGGILLSGFCEQRRYCTKEVRPAREFVTALPGTYIRSNSTTQSANDLPTGDITKLGVSFPIPVALAYADITVTWLDVPYDAVPFRAIAYAMGKVNDEFFELPQIPPPRYVAAETLLLQTFSIEDVFFPMMVPSVNKAPVSQRACNVTYYFRWRGGTSGSTRDELFGPRHPNWNKVPLPFVDANKHVVSQFTRVFRKPAAGEFVRNAKGDYMGIYDVFRFDYLFRPDRPFLKPDGSVIFP